MLEKWRGSCSVAMILSAVFAMPATALADRATVVLKDGRSFEGELEEYFPGDHVTLVLAGAQRQQIAASELTSVKVHAAATESAAEVVSVTSAPALQPAAASVQPAAYEAPTHKEQAQQLDRSGLGARGKLQLGLNAPLVRYSSLTRTSDYPTSFESSSVQWGLLRAPSVELGYGISDLFVIGAVVQLNGESNTSDTSDASSFGVFIGPKLDVQFDTASRFKPFFGAIVGLSYSSGDMTPKGPTQTVASNNQTTLFRLQARAGVRWFVTDLVSLDLALTGGFETGSSTFESASSPGASPDRKSELDQSGSFFGLHLGASVWPDL